MIIERQGDLLRDKADALVNTVNTKGVMGKGVALQFRHAFPVNYKAYRDASSHGQVQLGKMFVVDLGQMIAPRYVINFPTKEHWKTKSKLDDIATGLDDLVQVIDRYSISSIALPPLGCGNGGLRWDDVRPLIVRALEPLTTVEVHLYPPQEAPAPTAMVVNSKRPRMTWGRAAFVLMFDGYLRFTDELSMLEAQKLGYLLEEAGAPLKLDYVKAQFGPYAERLQHVLQNMEGHFITGYGDRSGPSQIRVSPGATDEAFPALNQRADTRQQIDRVIDLVEGFAWPYGLELLTSVHWVAHHSEHPATSAAEAVAQVHQWTPRKGRLFTDEHITAAWKHLQERGWLD